MMHLEYKSSQVSSLVRLPPHLTGGRLDERTLIVSLTTTCGTLDQPGALVVLIGRDGMRRSIGCLHFAEASGLDTHAIALLLPACEAGLLKSLRTLAA